mmetsp:Transcript_32818/g.82720  ORF Transcript_32818/g.82720 Transcript_32818/m.82720 type:complete len:259 (-) Transcript_32818:661-1437(-)
MVEVIATALRPSSTTERCVVPESSSWFHCAPYAVASLVASSEVFARSRALNAGDSMSASAVVKFGSPPGVSGSPRFMRMAKACLSASVIRCVPSVPADASGWSYPDRNSSTCATAAPPEDGGGIPSSVNPITAALSGATTRGRYCARSAVVTIPPASWMSWASEFASGPWRRMPGPSAATLRSVFASWRLTHMSPWSSGDCPSDLRNTAAVVGNLARNRACSAIFCASSFPTANPSARSAAGVTSRAQGSLPCRSHAT